MSGRKREERPSLEGLGKVAVEMERLRQKVVREKANGDGTIIDRMVWKAMNDSSYRPPSSGKIDFDEAFREARELLEELYNMSQDEFDATMTLEALAE